MMQCIIQPNGDFNPRSPDGERQVATSKFGQFLRISIHAPRMGSDLFQHALPDAGHDFNPRSPDGERLRDTLQHRLLAPISIHAPRMGSDPVAGQGHARHTAFQSTLPGWGATMTSLLGYIQQLISIHAPRMGSDRENGHLRPRYGQNHPFSTLIVSQIVVDVLGTVRKSQKHQRTSHYEVIKQPERQK